MRQYEWFSNNVCHWKTEQWLFWLLFQRLKMEMRKLMIDRNTFKCQLSILLTPGYLLRRDRCRLKFTHLTWIGLKIGTSTRGLSRWLRGRGWQVPHAGEFTSPTRGGRAWWRKVPRAARATLHRRKWLIHVGRRRTSCKERFTCEKPHLLTLSLCCAEYSTCQFSSLSENDYLPNSEKEEEMLESSINSGALPITIQSVNSEANWRVLFILILYEWIEYTIAFLFVSFSLWQILSKAKSKHLKSFFFML